MASVQSYYRARTLACYEKVAERAPKRLLDLGCNDGFFLSLVEGAEKHGVDLERLPGAGKGFSFQQHDLTRGIPHADASFDVVHTSEVIEHLPDTEAYLKECRRVLAPGGTLVLSTPNLHYWRNLVEWLLGNQFYFIDYRAGQEGHVRYFCPKTLRELAADAGFEDIRIETVGDWDGRNPVLGLIGKVFQLFGSSKNIILVMTARRPA
jgi:2-polyprenyl-3-methyl-5-hydroxy-6-metoxy-1,4-benzoquinol methylase